MVSGGGGLGFPELFVEFWRYNYFNDKLDDNVSKFLCQSGENYQGLDIHLTPQRRKCIESVLLTMSHELHCYSKGEKQTANTFLGLGKLHPSRRMGGVLFICPGFVLSVYVTTQSELFLTSFSLTVCSAVFGVYYVGRYLNPSAFSFGTKSLDSKQNKK